MFKELVLIIELVAKPKPIAFVHHFTTIGWLFGHMGLRGSLGLHQILKVTLKTFKSTLTFSFLLEIWFGFGIIVKRMFGELGLV